MAELQLLGMFNKLSSGASEAVQSGFDFSEFDKYMHVDRNIENELKKCMEEIDEANGGIILLVGSAGDGKSHLISKIKSSKKFKWDDDCYYNDATASCSPEMTALDTLKCALDDFDNTKIDSTNRKLVLAINLGKLSSFIDDEEVRIKYSELVNAVSFVFPEKKVKEVYKHPKVKVVLFLKEQFFEYKPKISNDYDSVGYPVESHFFSSILQKITAPQNTNPFYAAYLKDIENGVDLNNPLIINYKMLTLPEIQNTIVMSVIEAIIRFKLRITVREFLDFIYSIIVYPQHDSYDEKIDFFDALLPTMLYSYGDNNIQKKTAELDPLKYSNINHDSYLSVLFTTYDLPDSAIHLEKESDIPIELFNHLHSAYDSKGKRNSKEAIDKSRKLIFRLEHLMNYHSESLVYKSYLSAFSGYLLNDSGKVSEVFNMVNRALPRHYGSYYEHNGLIPLNIQGSEYRFFVNQQLIQHDNIKPDFSYTVPSCFQLEMDLEWSINSKDGDKKTVSLKIDYQLYSYIDELLKGKVAFGYNDEKDLVFSSFIKDLLLNIDCNQAIVIVKSDNTIVNLTKNHRSIILQ